MALEAKRSRHVAIAIPEVCISRIAVCPRQQSPQPQQPHVAYHQTLIGSWWGIPATGVLVKTPLDRGAKTDVA